MSVFSAGEINGNTRNELVGFIPVLEYFDRNLNNIKIKELKL